MRAHIEGNIFVSGNLGYKIEEKTTKNVKDPKTKIVSEVECYDIMGEYPTFAGVINGLLHHKIVSISNETRVTLEDLFKLVTDHKEFIESKLGGIRR